VAFLLLAFFCLCGCTAKDERPVVWIYTSLYKDTIAEIQPLLNKAFPNFRVQFFQAGSEEVSAKVSAEELAGGTRADVLIFSDRFWFEEMAGLKRLHAYAPKNTEKVDDMFKNKDSFYTVVSLPVMVMIYNTEAMTADQAPKTFKEMALPKWKGQFATGSPLASGTNFTTVAFLQKAYGWSYFEGLRHNDTIAEGGNSSVLRRVQTKERPVGWILLENILRLPPEQKKIQIIYPGDGVVLQTNVLGIIKKKGEMKNAEAVADWFFSPEGQVVLTHSYMYPTVPGVPAPQRAPPLADILKKAQKWTPQFVQEILKDREDIKEEFARIMLQ